MSSNEFCYLVEIELLVYLLHLAFARSDFQQLRTRPRPRPCPWQGQHFERRTRTESKSNNLFKVLTINNNLTFFLTNSVILLTRRTKSINKYMLQTQTEIYRIN